MRETERFMLKVFGITKALDCKLEQQSVMSVVLFLPENFLQCFKHITSFHILKGAGTPLIILCLYVQIAIIFATE